MVANRPGFVHHSHFASVKSHAADEEGGGQAHGKRIAKLIKDDEQQNQPGVVAAEKSRSGSATACSSDLGTGITSLGSGASSVAIIQGTSSAAISQYIPCQPR